tara:strand:+ start:68 stop:349 length:282 start_codon:yes stop_codon:yes gene_type:complete
MENQFVFNAIFAVVSLLGGWIFKMAWSRMTNMDDDLECLQKHHENDLKEVRRQMSELALSLPEKYVSKQDLDKLEDFINERFNKLEHKIDQLK